MLNKPKTCSGCTLANISKGFSIPDGTCKNGVLIIGESLGQNELKDARPFRPYAEAGSALNTAIINLGLNREDFGYWNLTACLKGNAWIYLADGTKKTISELVNSNFNGEVLSFDEKVGNFVPKKVIKVFKNLRLGRKFYKISYEGAKNTSKGSFGTVITQDHKCLTTEGWITAENLNGKLLNIGAHGFGNNAKAVILGTLLGDATINNNAIQVSHCWEQEEWVKLKARVLGVKEITKRRKNDNTYQYNFRTKATRYIAKLYEDFYKGRKTVPSRLQLTPQAIATWYLDDGSIITTRQHKLTKRKKARKNPLATFHVCNFKREEIEILQAELLKFDITSEIRIANGYYRLRLDVNGTKNLINLIGKYIPPSMRYKLGNIVCDEFDESLWNFEGEKAEYRRAIVTEYKPTKRKGRRKAYYDNYVYCLEVEDTNNFVTPSGVMHNCCPPFNKLEGAKYEADAINFCKQYFNEAIARFKPKVLIAAGSLPLKYLIPEIELWRNKAKEDGNKTLLRKLSITSLRGYKFDSSYKVPIVPTFHPSYVRRMYMIYLGIFMRDIQFALDIAKNKVPKLDFQYKVIRNVNDLESFYNYCTSNPNLPISYDIETPLTTIEHDETEIDFKGIEVRNIDTIQFRIEGRESIFVRWQEPFLDLIKKILETSNPKVGWNNWEFDQVNIEYHLGQGVIKGNNYDAMWLFKHLNSDFSKLGRGLQFASNIYTPALPAWKHIAEDEPEKYGCIDVFATLNNFEGIKKETKNVRFLPETKSIFEGYVDDIVNLKPILDDISKRGLPIDGKAKQELSRLVNIEIKKAAIELRNLFPEHLRLRKPLEGYKIEPKEVEEIRSKINGLVGLTPVTGSSTLFDGPEFVIHSDKLHIESRLIEFLTRQKDKTGLIKKQFIIDGRKVYRWCRLDEFKPNSSPQVISYMKWKKHKVPTKREKDGPKETSSKEDVSKLFEETGDKFYELIVYIRELKKIDSTYIKGWKTDDNSRVHTTFIPIAATGQLGSRNPNIQNAPARGTRFSSKGYQKLAEQFRTIIAAGEGKKIVEIDYSSFHALTLGFEAGDEKYIRLVRSDIHSYIAAQFLREELPEKLKEQRVLRGGKLEIKDKKEFERCEMGIDFLNSLDSWLDLSDEELKLKLKWIKSNFSFTRNSQAKPAILGIGFGAEEKKIYSLNRYSFKDVSQVASIFRFLRKEFPQLFSYQERIMNLAYKQTYLISRYGYIRRFFDVFDYRLLNHYRAPKGLHEKIFRDTNGKWWSKSPGGQAKEAIAFYPANDAFGKKKEAFRELWDYKLFDGKHVNLIQKFGAVNEIHDSIIFECPDELVLECATLVKEVMERPAKMLKSPIAPNGLICLTEAKVGQNWGSWNDNPEKGIVNLNGMKELKI